MRFPDGTFRLVKTYSRRKALNHIADSVFTVSIAVDDDLLLAQDGMVEIEYPGAEELVESSESPGN